MGRPENISNSRIYYYYAFDPATLQGDALKTIEADAEHHILDFPFANGDVYSDAFTSNFMSNSANLKDGNLYIVFKKESNLTAIFEGGQVVSEKLDELYLPEDDDKDLHVQAIANSQNITPEALKIKLPCLFKSPCGRVQYLDQETGQMEPVPHTQVWAIHFGIPRFTFTDSDGNYFLPVPFLAGTFMGTHAKNWLVNVKPMNTIGGFLQNVPQIILNFIMGSTHLEGWVNACQMRNDVNINFNNHTQSRHWAQILHAVRLHHDFAQQDGINSAPTGLTWYARWDESDSSWSASMLSHLHTDPFSMLDNLLSIFFDVNLGANAPNALNLFSGLLPSITSRESNNEDMHYSEELMQTSFHELAHASYFTKVGQIHWLGVISNIIAGELSSCDGYGCGTEPGAELTQVNEAWAEYLGKEHHRRIQPNAQCEIANNFWVSYPAALENDQFFINNWIPTGVFFDLTDNFNNNELLDEVQGFSIAQIFSVFSPQTNGICNYRSDFIQQFPNVTRLQFNRALQQNLFNDCSD